eukprot:TRINITY_DN30730_c0_g1_i1.p2 TRINITY_DN30730_c0_g1~~TRINITY_DN30730_c0_g1_i1.p2  ORF type:complete len:184 (+),score=39.12 TRINITY_DN30730_c0_g1_i1:26-553(+)
MQLDMITHFALISALEGREEAVKQQSYMHHEDEHVHGLSRGQAGSPVVFEGHTCWQGYNAMPFQVPVAYETTEAPPGFESWLQRPSLNDDTEGKNRKSPHAVQAAQEAPLPSSLRAQVQHESVTYAAPSEAHEEVFGLPGPGGASSSSSTGGRWRNKMPKPSVHRSADSWYREPG